MSTNADDLTTFSMRVGERSLIQVDFSPSLADGDYLVGAPAVATATLRGPSTAGSFTVSNLAFETGNTPTRVSFLANAMQNSVDYRVDCVADTNNGERKIVPVRVQVRV